MGTWRLVLIFAVISAAACGDNITPPDDAGPTADARRDAGVDAVPDARPDARPDAGHCAVSECTFGQTACGSDGTVVQCDVDAQGCGRFPAGGGARCGTHQTCGGAGGSAACGCTADATCPNGIGTYCTDGSDYATCTVDGQGCVYTASTTACTGVTSCDDGMPTGSAACECPADGSAAGEGCFAGGAGEQTCSGTDVLTCTTVGACDVWQTTTACAGSGLECAVSGTSAACACPSGTPGTFIADPNATPIAGVAAPGAASPVGCRFASLTTAVGSAEQYHDVAGSDATVLIESGSAGTFAAETWPIVLVSHVSVTSDDTAVPPARYTLAPGSGESAALVLTGSSLGGVAITANITGATSPPAAIEELNLFAGTASAALGPLAISFGSGATGDGIAIQVATTITGTTITGAYNGISVGSAGAAQAAAVHATISGTTIKNSRHDGLDVYATDATGVALSSTTIASSAHTGLSIDTTALSHSAAVSMTGVLGTTTITNDQSGATGLEVNNTNGSGATLNLTDVTVDGTPSGAGVTPGDSVDLLDATATLLGTVLEHNGFRGVYQFGGSATLADDAAGNHTTISGAQLGNSGLRIDAGATLNATNIVVESNTAWGANISNTGSANIYGTTTVTLTTCTFENNSNATYLDGGVQVGGNDSLDLSSLTIKGGTYGSNFSQGLHVGSNTTVTLSGALDVEHNGANGLDVDGANSTVSYTGAGSPVFSNNGGAGIYQTASTVTITPSTGTPTASSNTTNGIYVAGAASFAGSNFVVNHDTGVPVSVSTTSGTFALTNSTVENFTTTGVVIANTNATANAVVLDNVGVQAMLTPAAGTYGIEVEQSAVPASGYSTVIEDGYVETCETAVGIGAGTSNAVAVSLTGELIENNKACGVVVDSTSQSNAIQIDENQIVYNQAISIGASGATVGGLALEGNSPPTLVAISGNTIGGNSGEQIAVYASDGQDGAWFTTGNTLDRCTAATGSYDMYAEVSGTGIVTISSLADTWPASPDTHSVGADATIIVVAPNTGATCPTP
jgi:hypothetical protein